MSPQGQSEAGAACQGPVCLCRVECALNAWGATHPAFGSESVDWIGDGKREDVSQPTSADSAAEGAFEEGAAVGEGWGSPWKMARREGALRGGVGEAAFFFDPATSRRLRDAWQSLQSGEAKTVASRLSCLRPLAASLMSFLERAHRASDQGAVSCSAEFLLQEAQLRRLVQSVSREEQVLHSKVKTLASPPSPSSRLEGRTLDPLAVSA